jgi:hypothetical protein
MKLTRPSTAFVLASAVVLSVTAPAQEKPGSISHEDETGLYGARTITTAEQTYARIYKTGYSRTLAELGETPKGVPATASRANLVDHMLAKGLKNGYIFTYTPGAKDKEGHIATYTLSARPTKRRAGLRSYFADQTGVIRWTNDNRAATAKDPALEKLWE